MHDETPHAICGAKTRSGHPCKNPPMENGRCRMHGGTSLRGVASPTFKTGVNSRYLQALPPGLKKNYEAVVNDPDRVSLDNELGLLRAMLVKTLGQLGKGDNHPAWKEAWQAWQSHDKAIAQGDADKLLETHQLLGKIIEPNYREVMTEQKAERTIERIGGLVQKQGRILLDKHQVITAEQLTLILTTMIIQMRDTIIEHIGNDREARPLLIDLQAIYNRLVGGEESEPPMVTESQGSE